MSLDHTLSVLIGRRPIWAEAIDVMLSSSSGTTLHNRPLFPAPWCEVVSMAIAILLVWQSSKRDGL